VPPAEPALAPVRDDYEVIVVGAGTTGLILARLLTMQGVRVAVIDPNRIACQHPRASHLDDECMRITQTLGLAGQEPGYMVMSGFEVRDDSNRLLMSWEMTAGQTDQGWRSDYQFFQPDFEAVLRGKLAQTHLADLWLGWQVTDLDQHAGHVSVTVQNRASGAPRAVRGGYVVGCDGSHSVVREHVMHELVDFHGTQRSVIIDVQKFTSLDSLPAAATYIKAGPRPFTHQPASGGISRFQFMLIGDEDVESFEDPETVYRLLEPYLAPDSYRIMRTDVYEWHSRLVRGWRSGRMLIAGDAAHQMPPALGQGMCSGMRDAANLAWKLAAVVSGAGPDSLLDSYEQERAPHVRAMIIESTRQANLIAAAGRGEPVEASGTIDRSRGTLGRQLDLDRIGYPLAGHLSPQPRAADGTLLDDLVGYRFAVVGSQATIDAVDDATRLAWHELGAVVVPGFGAAMRWLADASADAALIRPDRYVFAATHGPEPLAQATALLRTQLGKQEETV
jgi:3-(3-hydroxy-phenyl)propionate hydroxylase